MKNCRRQKKRFSAQSELTRIQGGKANEPQSVYSQSFQPGEIDECTLGNVSNVILIQVEKPERWQVPESVLVDRRNLILIKED